MKTKIINNRMEILEIFIALLFMSSIWLDFITPKDLIVQILLFIVFIELTRMVITFVSEGKIMKIRYMVDGGIAFLLRELIIAISDHHLTKSDRLWEVGIILLTLTFLFLFRYAATKFSPERKGDDSSE